MGWEPLAAVDPIPGDPAVSERGAEHYGQISEAMAEAYDALGVMGDLAEFESEAVAALVEKADEVRDELRAARDRYQAASEVLTGYAADHREAQDAAARLLETVRGQQAVVDDQQAAVAAAGARLDEAEAAARSGGESASVDSSVRAAVQGAEGHLAEAQAVLAASIDQLPQIVSRWRERARAAAEQLRDSIERSGLNDGWWEKWGSDAANWLSKWGGKIAMWAGVASLVLGWVPVLGQVLVVVALVAGVAALVSDIALAVKGESDWTNAILGAIGLATFGVGRIVGAAFRSRAARGLAQGAARSRQMRHARKRFGSLANASAAREAWDKATSAFRSIEPNPFKPVSWFQSGIASFSGLVGRARLMNFMGHNDAARAYQALKNVNSVEPFRRNATAFPATLDRLGSLVPRTGSFGSALVPYTMDVAGNANLVYRDVSS